MIRKLLTVVTVLLVAGVAAGLVAAADPSLDVGGGTDGEPLPAGTPDASGHGGSAGTDDPATPPFTFTIDRVEECDPTCRDVTTTLINQQPTAASDVTVGTRIYAGNGTDGEVVWEGSEPVGDLGAGGSYTATKRVDLSVTDAYAVEREGGWITVRTTVEADGGTVAFTERRRVA